MTAAALALLFVFQSPAQPVERDAVQQARTAIVRNIDPTLPDRTFEAWLRDLFGPDAKTSWEVNDCGEQTGNPDLDRGRDFPMCVEAAVSLDSRRVLHVLLAVGTLKAGVKHQTPGFFSGYVLEAGAPIRSLKSLKDVATIVRSGILNREPGR